MISFKNFILEGAYVQFDSLKELGTIPVTSIDMRFEDWSIDNGEFLEGGYKNPPRTNFIAKYGQYYIVYKLGSYANIRKSLNVDEAKYEIVPKGWEKYAEFYNDNQIVKPALYDAMKRLGI